MCRDVLANQDCDFFIYPAVKYYKQKIFYSLNFAKDKLKGYEEGENITVYNNEKIEAEEILKFFNDLEGESFYRSYLIENAETIKKAYEFYKQIFKKTAVKYENLDYFFYGIGD